MNREYWHAREVTRLYDELSVAQQSIEMLNSRISCLEVEVNALLELAKQYLDQLLILRSSFWI